MHNKNQDFPQKTNEVSGEDVFDFNPALTVSSALQCLPKNVASVLCGALILNLINPENNRFNSVDAVEASIIGGSFALFAVGLFAVLYQTSFRSEHSMLCKAIKEDSIDEIVHNHLKIAWPILSYVSYTTTFGSEKLTLEQYAYAHILGEPVIHSLMMLIARLAPQLIAPNTPSNQQSIGDSTKPTSTVKYQKNIVSSFTPEQTTSFNILVHSIIMLAYQPRSVHFSYDGINPRKITPELLLSFNDPTINTYIQLAKSNKTTIKRVLRQIVGYIASNGTKQDKNMAFVKQRTDVNLKDQFIQVAKSLSHALNDQVISKYVDCWETMDHSVNSLSVKKNKNMQALKKQSSNATNNHLGYDAIYDKFAKKLSRIGNIKQPNEQPIVKSQQISKFDTLIHTIVLVLYHSRHEYTAASTGSFVLNALLLQKDRDTLREKLDVSLYGGVLASCALCLGVLLIMGQASYHGKNETNMPRSITLIRVSMPIMSIALYAGIFGFDRMTADQFAAVFIVGAPIVATLAAIENYPRISNKKYPTPSERGLGSNTSSNKSFATYGKEGSNPDHPIRKNLVTSEGIFGSNPSKNKQHKNTLQTNEHQYHVWIPKVG